MAVWASSVAASSKGTTRKRTHAQEGADGEPLRLGMEGGDSKAEEIISLYVK